MRIEIGVTKGIESAGLYMVSSSSTDLISSSAAYGRTSYIPAVNQSWPLHPSTLTLTTCTGGIISNFFRSQITLACVGTKTAVLTARWVER